MENIKLPEINDLKKKINELESEIRALKNYGLIWDKEKVLENVVEQCKNQIPILLFDDKKDLTLSNLNNILIEGDNFHALLALNLIMQNSIDIIYIDPPYNTGNNNFVYNDKFVNSDDGYIHSKWLQFMSKRLVLARRLLKNDGIIFISIDDHEQANLKLLCDSIFGENNFICNFIWQKTSNPNSTSNNVGIVHEYVLCYSKKPVILAKQQYNESEIAGYKFSDKYLKERGMYKLVGLNKTGTVNDLRPNLMYNIKAPDGSVIKPKPRWRWSKERFEKGLKEDRVVFSKKAGKWTVYYKQYFLEDNNGNKIQRGALIKSIFTDYGRTTDGNNDLKNILGKNNFDFPKPVNLIKKLISFVDNKNATILDFFAGSGTTGQAVLELNKEDGGNRKFILCTNNEGKICENITYPRLKTVLTGKRKDDTNYGKALSANLHYFKTDLVHDDPEADQSKFQLVEKLDSLLCIYEDVFNKHKEAKEFSHFSSYDDKKHVFIYKDIYGIDSFDKLCKYINKYGGNKILYMFTLDDCTDFAECDELNDVEIKPIPAKMYEIYKTIAEEIKRGE